MRIADREIGPHVPPFIIAEISCNHMGDKDRAVALIAAAASCGADAVKFQLFTPDDMAQKDGPPLTEGPWAGRTLYDLYTEAMTPRGWFPELFAYARECGLIPFTSVLNPADVDFLEGLDCPAYKIPSAEIGWTELITAFAATRKPLLISTGMATSAEVWAALVATRSVCDAITLHCVSAYPTPVEAAHLRHFEVLRWVRCGGDVGVSDHSLGDVVPIAATALGACVIEKHLMLAGTHPLDEGHSLTPDQFARMVTNVKQTWAAMQEPTEDVEQASRQFKRRLINGRWLRG